MFLSRHGGISLLYKIAVNYNGTHHPIIIYYRDWEFKISKVLAQNEITKQNPLNLLSISDTKMTRINERTVMYMCI